jgi:hypothetical protein
VGRREEEEEGGDEEEGEEERGGAGKRGGAGGERRRGGGEKNTRQIEKMSVYTSGKQTVKVISILQMSLEWELFCEFNYMKPLLNRVKERERECAKLKCEHLPVLGVTEFIIASL